MLQKKERVRCIAIAGLTTGPDPQDIERIDRRHWWQSHRKRLHVFLLLERMLNPRILNVNI